MSQTLPSTSAASVRGQPGSCFLNKMSKYGIAVVKTERKACCVVVSAGQVKCAVLILTSLRIEAYVVCVAKYLLTDSTL